MIIRNKITDDDNDDDNDGTGVNYSIKTAIKLYVAKMNSDAAAKSKEDRIACDENDFKTPL